MANSDGGHDDTEWRKAQRNRREKGCWVYISRNTLALSLVAPHSEKPPESRPGPITGSLFYRVLPWGKNRVIVAFKQGEES